MKFYGYLVRTLGCFLLLFATWNPAGYSYLSWLGEDDGARLSLKVAVGVALFMTYVVYLRIAWLALGTLGVGISAAIMLSGYMALRHFGVFDAGAPFWTGYLVLTIAAVTLSAGLCWAHFKRRVIGTSQVIYPPP